jgi:hypothetical protein
VGHAGHDGACHDMVDVVGTCLHFLATGRDLVHDLLGIHEFHFVDSGESLEQFIHLEAHDIFEDIGR